MMKMIENKGKLGLSDFLRKKSIKIFVFLNNRSPILKKYHNKEPMKNKLLKSWNF